MSVETLRKARTRIALYGWTQRKNQDEQGRTCIEGAILSTDHALADQRCAGYFIAQALGTRGVQNWNDVQGRTQAEVLDLFDKAIALAEQAETVEVLA